MKQIRFNFLLHLILLFSFQTVQADFQEFDGENKLFKFSVGLNSNDSDSKLSAHSVAIETFQFEYTPKRFPITPMDLYYKSIFGNTPFVLTEKDVVISKMGHYLAVASDSLSGNYLEIELKPEARKILKGYTSFGIQTSASNGNISVHNVIIFQGTLSRTQYLLHLLVIGRQYFREAIMTLNRRPPITNISGAVSCISLLL